METTVPDRSAAAPRFSIGDVAFEGLRVVGAHWRLLAGWAVFNLVSLVLLIVVTVTVMVLLNAAGGGTQASAIGGLLGFVGAVMIQVMIATALMRTLMRADEPGFLHLRLGPDEFRILAVWLIVGGAGFLYLIVCWSLVALVQRVAETPPALVLGVALFALLVYLTARFGMSAPATFDRRRLSILEGWRLSRGHTGQLMGVVTMAACFIAMVMMVTWMVLFLAVGSASGFDVAATGFSDAQAVTEHPGAFLIQTLGELIVGPVLLTIGQTPFVAAYLSFARAPETGEPVVPASPRP